MHLAQRGMAPLHKRSPDQVRRASRRRRSSSNTRSTGAAALPGGCGGIIGRARSALTADPAAPGRYAGLCDYHLGERDYRAAVFTAP